MQRPKHIYRPFKNRNISIGKERRLNFVKRVLENQANFPKTVTYEDIDKCVFDFVDKCFCLELNGKRFPTYKLFSNQRISEYGQNWKEVDDKGNIEINFKTLTRDNNPQKGTMYGDSFNIPTEILYPIFRNVTYDDNGDEIIEQYSMKQPYVVDLLYTITVFTSSYKILNEMNEKVLAEFKGFEKYVFPNGYSMPMTLDSIEDESEYQIDDRKYYAQSYKIKLLGYLIRQEDYVVQKVPSRKNMSFVAGINSRKKRNVENFKAEEMFDKNSINVQTSVGCDSAKIENIEVEVPFDEQVCKVDNSVEFEEYEGKQECWAGTEDSIYVNRKVVITINFTECSKVCEFELDTTLEMETIELNNIKTYEICLNSEIVDVENSDVTFNDGDTVKVSCTLKNETKDARIRLVCYDPSTIIDRNIENTTENITI